MSFDCVYPFFLHGASKSAGIYIEMQRTSLYARTPVIYMLLLLLMFFFFAMLLLLFNLCEPKRVNCCADADRELRLCEYVMQWWFHHIEMKAISCVYIPEKMDDFICMAEHFIPAVPSHGRVSERGKIPQGRVG